MNSITKELAETLRELRTKFDAREHLGMTMVRADAALDRYDDACKQMPSEDAMAIVDDILERYAEPFMNPEPIITRVEVITDNGREYVSWNKDNVITTSLQDDGKTLKIFVTTNTNTEEPKTTPQPEPIINKVEVIANTKGTEMKLNLKEFLNKKVTVKLYNGSIITGVILRNPDEGLFRLQYEPLVSDIDDSYSGYHEKTILVFRKYMEDGVYVPTGKTHSEVFNHGYNIVDIQLTEAPKMTITKPPFYYNLPEENKTLYRVAEEEVSKQWATALSGLVDNLGGDKPALWEWEGKIPTPEKVVKCLQELLDFHMQIAADNELEACLEVIAKEYPGGTCDGKKYNSVIYNYVRDARRPQPTLKSQALRDFETVRKHSDLLPEILDNIENALKSLPE